MSRTTLGVNPVGSDWSGRAKINSKGHVLGHQPCFHQLCEGRVKARSGKAQTSR